MRKQLNLLPNEVVGSALSLRMRFALRVLVVCLLFSFCARMLKTGNSESYIAAKNY